MWPPSPQKGLQGHVAHPGETAQEHGDRQTVEEQLQFPKIRYMAGSESSTDQVGDRDEESHLEGPLAVPAPAAQVALGEQQGAEHDWQDQDKGCDQGGYRTGCRLELFHPPGPAPRVDDLEVHGPSAVSRGLDADRDLRVLRINTFPGRPAVGVIRGNSVGRNRAEARRV